MKGRVGVASGQRDRLIEIQQRSATDTPDPDSGEPQDGDNQWTVLVAEMPAAKTDVSGWERFQQQQTSARYDQRWVINYRTDMDPELVDVPKVRRLKVGARILEIVAANELGRRQAIELLTLASTTVPA